MKYVIFGDSFSDPSYKFTTHKNWYDYFEDVENYSTSGIGAVRLLKMFLNFVESKKYDLTKYNLIFLIPDCYRLDLNYLPNYNLAANGKSISDWMNDPSTINDKIKFEYHYDFFNKNKEKIHRDYIGFYDSGLNDLFPLFILNNVLMYECFFNKILLWPCNNVYTGSRIDKISETTDKRHMIKKSLYDISREEFSDLKMPKYEKRNNHLSEKNHKKVYEIISDWFTNNGIPTWRDNDN